MEASDGGRYADDSEEFRRPSIRRDEPAWDDNRHSSAADRAARRTDLSSGAPVRRQPSAAQDDTGLRGFLAVAAVLLVTLAAAAADSFLGTGLGLITLIGLVLATAVAAFLVRRRDLTSLLVAPPLVYVAVTAITATVSSSGHPSLAALASQLIRGFPAMGIATGAALLIALFRLATRR